MNTSEAHKKFSQLSFDSFRKLACDQKNSKYEKIGFPDTYRQGHELTIFEDIKRKLTYLNQEKVRVLDIGPGCSDLPHMLIENSIALNQSLWLVDSAEMLSLLPEHKALKKVAGRFPEDTKDFIEAHQGTFNVLLCYSVFHYIFSEGNVFKFFDDCLSLLAEQGQMLIGDIPNISKRKRFFSSSAGLKFHQSFMQTKEKPAVEFNILDKEQIDDSVLLGLMIRARNAGFDAYIVPQDQSLPMANRREDLLIVRP